MIEAQTIPIQIKPNLNGLAQESEGPVGPWTIALAFLNVQSAQKNNCFQWKRIQVWTIIIDEDLELNDMIPYIIWVSSRF